MRAGAIVDGAGGDGSRRVSRPDRTVESGSHGGYSSWLDVVKRRRRGGLAVREDSMSRTVRTWLVALVAIVALLQVPSAAMAVDCAFEDKNNNGIFDGGD